jgi:FtsZ-interacting cell division protein ZipA
MSSLQIGLFVAGVLLVIGVILYNRWQERRAREQLQATRLDAESRQRVEPTLRRDDDDAFSGSNAEAAPSTLAAGEVDVAHDPDWRPPMDGVVTLPDEGGRTLQESAAASLEDVPPDPAQVSTRAGTLRHPRTAMPAQLMAAAPDPDIETIVMLQPAKPVAAGALAAGLHARLGKPVRWYGRRESRGPWQRLAADSRGEYSELAACMLLADRNGPASLAQIESFRKLASEIATSLPGAYSGAPGEDEAQRAEALDRLCAELDMQIGLTVRKVPPAIIAGTRLRGVAEASGFRLAPTGRFEWVQDDTGAVLFTLQNITDEAFTPDRLRSGSTPGVIFLLDVPRVADPAKAFDQMKLAAKRMAKTVGGELVDDNGRPLNDAGLGAIREQVAAADAALRRYNIEPGSPRALKLFAA